MKNKKYMKMVKIKLEERNKKPKEWKIKIIQKIYLMENKGIFQRVYVKEGNNIGKCDE